MTEYQRQAKDFLESCNATMKINFVGTETNTNWNETDKRNKYHFTIITPKGKMEGDFWDSIYNTEISLMSLDDYFKKRYRRCAKDSTLYEQSKANKALALLKADAKPTEYDILACLTKYHVGSMDDFMHEFGYEIKSVREMTNFINTYNAVVQEYQDLCRIFTETQMERLREIW